MNDTGTVFCRHIITRNYPESALTRIEPRDKLLITDTCQVRTLQHSVKNLERYKFVACLIVFKRDICCLRIEMCVHKSLSHNIEGRLTCIWIE